MIPAKLPILGGKPVAQQAEPDTVAAVTSDGALG
jgi:hypothetical protein